MGWGSQPRTQGSNWGPVEFKTGSDDELMNLCFIPNSSYGEKVENMRLMKVKV